MALGGVRSERKQAEWAARWLVAGFALGLPLAALGASALDRSPNVVEVHVRMAEAGGWLPGNLNAVAGEPLNLRLVSDDVIHGFAIGQMDTPALDLPPGQVVRTTLTFERPGTYTYYCTRWCGLGHWRMRGTITVSGERAEEAKTQAPPPYVRLGIDIDAPHPAGVVPEKRPQAVNGAEWSERLPPEFQAPAAYETASPAAVWQQLHTTPSTQALSSAQLWDLVAWVWQSNTTAADIGEGQALYSANCAACHGEQGAGDGVFAATLAEAGQTAPGHGIRAPVDFTDAIQMLGASSALLHGKIIRGGMGTGMPYWGPILTERQIWTLIDYLWSFQFEYSENDR